MLLVLWRVGLAAALIVLLARSLAAQPSDARGVVITVTTKDDNPAIDGNCSLREAVRAVNQHKQVDTCIPTSHDNTILLSAGTYTLTLGMENENENAAATGDLDITTDMTIMGAGAQATSIVGMKFDRVIEIRGESIVNLVGVTIRGGVRRSGNGGGILNSRGVLTLTNSAVSDNLTLGGGGGGIANGGTLTLVNSSVVNNSGQREGGGVLNTGTATVLYSSLSNDFGNDGGGIANHGTLAVSNSSLTLNAARRGGGIFNDAALTVEGSTLDHNRAGAGSAPASNGDGGGIFNDGDLTLTNSTISANSTTFDGGGIANHGTAQVSNATIADNIADRDNRNGGDGGGVAIGGGKFAAQNTIIANNTDASGQAADCAGRLTSGGYNLIRSAKGCTIAGTSRGNRLGADPKLGPLQNNGGTVDTYALLAGSKAIDAGNPAEPGSRDSACPTTDTRGVARPTDGNRNGTFRCDIGALESRAGGPRRGTGQLDGVAPGADDASIVSDTGDGPDDPSTDSPADEAP
jgi:CSLREA domain-containing protein